MKLSKREKILLCLLAVLVVSYIYYTYMLTPLLQKVEENKAVLEEKRQKEAFTKIQMASNSKLSMDYKALNANLEMITHRFFPLIIQEKIVIYIEEMIKGSRIKVSNITFSEPSLNAPKGKNKETRSEIDPEIQKILDEIIGKTDNDQTKSDDSSKSQSKAGKEKNQGSEDSYSLEHMSVSMVVEGSYDKIMNFLKKIEYFNKKILIGSVNLISNENALLSGTIMLDFYAVPKLQINDDEYLSWESLYEYGKENPFEPFSYYIPQQYTNESSINVGSNSNKANNTAIRKIYDFKAIIKPVSSDLPAFIIGDAKEKNGKSYLYADNPNYENVEFNVFKQAGKYYYRYRIENISYPKNYENELVEFSPYAKSIEFKIDSQLRNDNNDVNGINITIINNSDLTLNVDISNDDSKRPRVNISKLQGNIKVNR